MEDAPNMEDFPDLRDSLVPPTVDVSFDPGLTNAGLAVCVNGQIAAVMLWDIKDKNKTNPKSQAVDFAKLNRELHILRDKIMQISPHSKITVLIENQAAAGKCQQGTLNVAACFECIVGTAGEVKMVNACVKLKQAFSDWKSAKKSGKKPGQDHYNNKKLVVAFMKKWIDSHEGMTMMSQKLRDLWKGMSKQDDIADALMMILSHLKKLKKAPMPPVPHRTKGSKSKEQIAIAAAAAAAITEDEAYAIATAKDIARQDKLKLAKQEKARKNKISKAKNKASKA